MALDAVYALFADETSQAVNYSRATYKKAVDLTHDSAFGVYNFAVNKSQKVVDAAQAKTQQAHDILVVRFCILLKFNCF